MPRCDSSAPRKKLPPPTTTATSTPDRTAAAISPAMRCTTSGASPTDPPPKVSPDSLSSTRRAFGSGVPGRTSVTSATCPPVACVGSSGAGRGAGACVREWPRPVGRGPLPGDSLVSGSHAEPREARHGAAGLGEDLADRLLRVLGERLVEQHVLLEEAVQAALDDLRERGLGLALVARGLLGDVALGGDGLRRDVV